VDESDKLYYDNLKKNENNFKVDSMENLEQEDPWLNKNNNINNL
jgi:hypothetical protein